MYNKSHFCCMPKKVQVKKWSKLTIFALKTWKIYDIRHFFVGCRIECEVENNQCCLFYQRAIRAKTLEWWGGSRIEPRKTGLRGGKILDRTEKSVTWCNVDSPETKWSVVNQSKGSTWRTGSSWIKYKISHNSRRRDFLCLFT